MVQEVMICDVDIMYFYNSIINHTLSDPQWRASRADMWVRHDHSPWVLGHNITFPSVHDT